ncbi:MAG: ECF transporter S component [Candidatus Bathyarchaeota archaeon]|nr:MAG: ECF transporter S component [Candidatus Bathyarchaeota archaeon]
MFNAKNSAFIAIMAALGNILAVLSINVAPIANGVAMDLSHIATFIAAVFGGPWIGAIVGFSGAIYPGYYFGFLNPTGTLGFLSLVGIPLGKALTGLMAGLLYRGLKINGSSRPSSYAVPVILLSYIPECLFTIVYFLYLVVPVVGQGMAFMLPIILPKAWIEIIMMSFLMGALVGNVGFRDFVARYLSPKP